MKNRLNERFNSPSFRRVFKKAIPLCLIASSLYLAGCGTFKGYRFGLDFTPKPCTQDPTWTDNIEQAKQDYVYPNYK